MDNFRDYASRIRTHAAAAAKRIPTFDDMAANDDYIHSEEFNVREQSHINKKTDVVSARAPAMDQDDTSSMGSWSLLDRPAKHLRSPVPPSAKEKLEASSPQASLQGGIESTNMSADTSLSSGAPSSTQRRLSHSSSGLPLLSVVANTLESTGKNQSEKDDSDDAGALQSEDSSEINSLDSCIDEDDEDDPIMSMIRKTRSTTKQLKSQSCRRKQQKEGRSEKKSAQGFMQGLEERIAKSEPEQMEAGLLSTQKSNATSPQTALKNPFGSWVKNMAKTQLERILRRPEAPSPSSITSKAPLARERPQSTKLDPAASEKYHKAASSSMLGDDELNQLAKFRNSENGGAYAYISGIIQEYRNFALILFTLILAFIVYFFQNAADDVS